MRPVRTLGVESLEDRTQPATFGIPWQSPDHLTVSFAPDGTALAGHASDLFAALDTTGQTADWQRTILQAVQAWAVHANINVGVRGDTGAAFGTPGLVQQDPRFGDIRVGGNPMASEVLALGTPPDPASSGTWSGDILLNTAYQFDGNPYSLLAVALHESGHALGLDNSAVPNSVMFTRYDQTRTQLSAEDIARIQGMYGVRAPDSFEGALGNNTRGRASAMPRPTGYVGETPLVAFADITTAGDVDFFRVTVPTDGNDDQFDRSITVRLQSAGASLLAPRLTVMDATGRVLANRVSRSATGDVLQVELNNLTGGGTYFVRVQAAAQGSFSVGRYGLSVRFNNSSSVADPIIDRLLSGPFNRLGADAIDAFFRNGGEVLVSPEEVTDTTATAVRLSGTAGFDGRRFEAVGSVTKAEDVDVYRLVAPPGNNVLTATVWTPDTSGFQARVAVLNAAGQVLPAAVLANGDGTSTVQVSGVTAGATYFLRVILDAAATADKGNYFFSSRFGTVAAQQTTFASGTLSDADREDTNVVYVGEAQLFHLVLTAAGSPGASVRLTVTDETGAVVYDVTAASGASASRSSVLLRPGAYTVRVAVENPSGAVLAYSVLGSVGTNPIGPATLDPTLKPKYVTPPPTGSTTPTFAYPPPQASTLPPSQLPGFVIPGDPSTYPPGWLPLPDLFDYPWLLLSPNPYYWLSLAS